MEAAGHGVHSGMSAATTQLGTTGILHGSKSIVMQTKDGQVVEPHSISAGLDYPGIGPLHAFLYETNVCKGQTILAQRLGKKKIIAETGAGQHGVATATVCALKGMECVVYMGEKDIERQAPNVARMKMLGAKVVPATSGSKTLKDATNEAIRAWINEPETTHYIIGSVVGPHPYPDMVARFQSVISAEIRTQLKEKTGSALPTHVVAGAGGVCGAGGLWRACRDAPVGRRLP